MWLGKQRGRAEVSDTYSVSLHGEVIHIERIRVNDIQCKPVELANGTKLCNQDDCSWAMGNFFYGAQSFTFTKPVEL